VVFLTFGTLRAALLTDDHFARAAARFTAAVRQQALVVVADGNAGAAVLLLVVEAAVDATGPAARQEQNADPGSERLRLQNPT
jgi:hypothetical protein